VGAHGLLVLRPRLRALDQQARHDVVDGSASARAPTGAPPPSRARRRRPPAAAPPRAAAVVREAHPRALAGLDGEVGHAAQQRRPGRAGRGVAAPRTGAGWPMFSAPCDARQHGPEVEGPRPRRLRVEAFAVRDGAHGVVRAGPGQHVEQAESVASATPQGAMNSPLTRSRWTSDFSSTSTSRPRRGEYGGQGAAPRPPPIREPPPPPRQRIMTSGSPTSALPPPPPPEVGVPTARLESHGAIDPCSTGGGEAEDMRRINPPRWPLGPRKPWSSS
jgi:hypothetical protein